MSKRAKQKGSPARQTRSTAANVASDPSSMGAPKLRKRPNLTVRVSNQLYAEIQAAADRAGRSLSEEVERRLERATEWDAVFESATAFKAKFKADHEELEHGDTEAVLPRRGYTKVFDARFGGHAWLPPGQLPAVHDQITSQAEFREFQAAKKAAEQVAKETPMNRQHEDLEQRIIRLLRLAQQKDEETR
jgi:hypothetical protein